MNWPAIHHDPVRNTYVGYIVRGGEIVEDLVPRCLQSDMHLPRGLVMRCIHLNTRAYVRLCYRNKNPEEIRQSYQEMKRYLRTFVAGAPIPALEDVLPALKMERDNG